MRRIFEFINVSSEEYAAFKPIINRAIQLLENKDINLMSRKDNVVIFAPGKLNLEVNSTLVDNRKNNPVLNLAENEFPVICLKIIKYEEIRTNTKHRIYAYRAPYTAGGSVNRDGYPIFDQLGKSKIMPTALDKEQYKFVYHIKDEVDKVTKPELMSIYWIPTIDEHDVIVANDIKNIKNLIVRDSNNTILYEGMDLVYSISLLFKMASSDIVFKKNTAWNGTTIITVNELYNQLRDTLNICNKY